MMQYEEAAIHNTVLENHYNKLTLINLSTKFNNIILHVQHVM